jgi:hypothetical protein
MVIACSQHRTLNFVSMALSAQNAYVWVLETAWTLLLAVALPLFMAIQLIVGKGTIRVGVIDRSQLFFLS